MIKMENFKNFELSHFGVQLGMGSMYTGDADLNGLLESTSKAGSLRVSKVVHKAFIDVNEAGSEAGASTSKPFNQ